MVRCIDSIVHELSPFLDGNIILDIGSGSGQSGMIFRKKGMTVISLDLNAESLKEGLRTGRIERGFALRADARNIPFKDGAIGVLSSIYFLHTVKEKRRVLGEMKRQIKSGGMVMVSDICAPTMEDQTFINTYHNMETRCGHIALCSDILKGLRNMGLRIVKKKFCAEREELDENRLKMIEQRIDKCRGGSGFKFKGSLIILDKKGVPHLNIPVVMIAAEPPSRCN